MGKKTGISWCDHTFNPWWGCVKVSEGCQRCYAETLAKRFGPNLWGPNSRRRMFGNAHWAEPFKWNRDAERDGVRRRVFCASMADVFENVNEVWKERERLWDLIEATPHLEWLLLTKRPENILRLTPWQWAIEPPANVRIGTTIEMQRWAKPRLEALLRWPGKNFLSVEPMLEPVRIAQELVPEGCDWERVNEIPNVREPEEFIEECEAELDWINCGNGLVVNPEWNDWQNWRHNRARLFAMGRGVDWVIIGGESGAGARRMETWWVTSLVMECQLAQVPVFVKQLGGHPDKRDRMEDWPSELQVREFPEEVSSELGAVSRLKSKTAQNGD
jgi:protein gp37